MSPHTACFSRLEYMINLHTRSSLVLGLIRSSSEISVDAGVTVTIIRAQQNAVMITEFVIWFVFKYTPK